MNSFIKKWPIRKALIISWHTFGVYLTYYFAYIIRFDDKLHKHVNVYDKTALLLLVCTLLSFLLFKQFSGLWRYYSIDDVLKTVLASTLAISLFSFLTLTDFIFDGLKMSRAVILAEWVFLIGWSTGSRAFIRYMREKRRKWVLKRREYGQRVLVVGSVAEADLLIRGCTKHFDGTFCGILTNEIEFSKRALHGAPVYSLSLEDVGHLVKSAEISDIHILSPFNKPATTNKIIDSCAKAGVSANFHTIPSLKDMASGDISASMIRDVEVADLLGRVEADLPRDQIRAFVNNKKVLVTGAGGSIGSELCRQILSYKPAVLILFEFSEIALYQIEKELQEFIVDSSCSLIAFAGDIRQADEVVQAINLVNGVDIIYHAAAYKHVPLMEGNVSAAFRNNVLGTACLASVAEKCNVKKFVMISSDKAVRPSNVMGATKRIAERVIQERKSSITEFVAVRFGNVLGSSGSVIPLFKKQIAEGKPLTVTTKNMQRFFMTIPEAVDLVLMAGTVAKPSQIMVLEMGEPVKIYDLAVRLIELSGFTPHKDVNIEFCGLRPGEKEYEEILTEDESVIKTDLERIWLMEKDESKQQGKPINLELIEAMVTNHDEQGLRKLIFDYVPENTFKQKSFSIEISDVKQMR